jgi:uncharacterized protein
MLVKKLRRVGLVSPGRHVGKIAAPTLVQLAKHDDVTQYAKAQKIVARIPRGQVLSYGCTHFEPYLDPHFEQIVSDQIQFLQRHVPISS